MQTGQGVQHCLGFSRSDIELHDDFALLGFEAAHGASTTIVGALRLCDGFPPGFQLLA